MPAVVRVEVICPGGDLQTDLVALGGFQTLGFEVDCVGLLGGSASIRAIVDV